MTLPVQIGDIVETSYGSMPYRVIEVTHDCTCVHYIDQINHRDLPQPPHMHLVCVMAYPPAGVEQAKLHRFWLNHYAKQPDGTIRNVRFTEDTITVTGKATGIQLGLF